MSGKAGKEQNELKGFWHRIYYNGKPMKNF